MGRRILFHPPISPETMVKNTVDPGEKLVYNEMVL